MKTAFCIFLVCISGFVTVLQAQELNQQTDQYLQRYYELMRFNGRVLVANDQEVLYDKAWGLADHGQGISFTDSSLFNIGGLSEQFTAYIVFQLISQDKLSLQKPVKAYIRDVNWGTKANITLHHLLTHTSGLPDYPQVQAIGQQFSSVAEMKEYVGTVSLQSKPGTSFGYSKLNYNLVGLILEGATGKTYRQLVEEWITQPLKLQHTFVVGMPEAEAHMVKGHLTRSYAEGWQTVPNMHPANLFASQGIVSNPKDLLIWYRNLKERLWKHHAYHQLFTPYLNHYGWGFRISRDEHGKLRQLSSLDGIYNGGFNAWSVVDDESDLFILVLSNNRHPVAGEIGEGLMKIYVGKPYNMPLARVIVPIDPALLKDYSGEYTLNEKVVIKVLQEDNSLFIDDGMRPRFEIFPQSPTHFFIKDLDASISFERNKEGKVAEMVLYDGFAEGMAVKKTK